MNCGDGAFAGEPLEERMAETGYFHRVHAQTPTRFWINNPTREEADWALAEGAVGCTCNPSYCQKMIDHPTEGDYARRLLDEAVRESSSDDEAEAVLQRKLVAAIAAKFMPLYESSGGRYGHVSIQGDPIHEDDPQVIVDEGHLNGELGPNITLKIPTTAAGLRAMETLMAEGYRINATEIMGIKQALDVCAVHQRVTRDAGTAPGLYLSHITGIYDEYLRRAAADDHIDISPDIMWQAGLAIARKLYAILKERGLPGTFIGGGARGLQHFTEMVGGDVVVTINWVGTADALLEQDPPVVFRLFNPVEPYVVEELLAKLPDFRRGFLEDGLSVEEYEEFGPVVLFRESFVTSWRRVLGLAREQRRAVAGHGA
jgi:transaldolase